MSSNPRILPTKNGVSPILEEKENPTDETNKTVLPELEEKPMDLPNEQLAITKEAQLNLEANLPDSIKEILSLPTTPQAKPKEDLLNHSEGTPDLTSAIQAISKRKKLGSNQRKRLWKQFKEPPPIANSEKKLDIPFWWEAKEVAWQLQLNAEYSPRLF